MQILWNCDITCGLHKHLYHCVSYFVCYISSSCIDYVSHIGYKSGSSDVLIAPFPSHCFHSHTNAKTNVKSDYKALSFIIGANC